MQSDKVDDKNSYGREQMNGNASLTPNSQTGAVIL